MYIFKKFAKLTNKILSIQHPTLRRRTSKNNIDAARVWILAANIVLSLDTEISTFNLRRRMCAMNAGSSSLRGGVWTRGMCWVAKKMWVKFFLFWIRSIFHLPICRHNNAHCSLKAGCCHAYVVVYFCTSRGSSYCEAGEGKKSDRWHFSVIEIVVRQVNETAQ